MKPQLIPGILDPSPQTLDNFVGYANAAVVQALQAQSLPGRSIYIWGPPGSGRSHLLHAASQESTALYVNAHERAFQALLRDDTLPYSLIAIDDIETLDENGQAILFSLYNRWRERASSSKAFALLIAGNQAPMAMPVREDLRTRLGWDLSFRLHLLSDEERANALQERAKDRSLNLAPEIISWLLTHYSRDMRALTALLDALEYYALEQNRPITLALLKNLLASQPLSKKIP